MATTSSHLPLNPIKRVYTCPNCNKVHVTFWGEEAKRIYSQHEWEYIVSQGVKALKKITEIMPISDDPKVF